MLLEVSTLIISLNIGKYAAEIGLARVTRHLILSALDDSKRYFRKIC